MRNSFPFLVATAPAAVMPSGCANVEKQLGRGMSNMLELVRGGEFSRTMEQTALFDGPDYSYTTGLIRGVNRTLARTGVGFYEVVTAPFPPYDPVFTDYLTPNPVYADNYQPGLLDDQMFATDTYLGFSGGEVAPLMPGSRFRIFDTH